LWHDKFLLFYFLFYQNLSLFTCLVSWYHLSALEFLKLYSGSSIDKLAVSTPSPQLLYEGEDKLAHLIANIGKFLSFIKKSDSALIIIHEVIILMQRVSILDKTSTREEVSGGGHLLEEEEHTESAVMLLVKASRGSKDNQRADGGIEALGECDDVEDGS
jgi:hypothetical protein